MSLVAVAILNTLLWPFVHLTISWWAFRRKVQHFDENSFLYQERGFEKNGVFYEKFFLIKRWKRLLPDGAAIIGVKIDRNMSTLSSADGQEKLYFETLRSEWAHWMMILLGLVLSAFNRFEIWLIMLCYAALANLPCILAQRYNRIKLRNIRLKRRKRNDSI